MNLKDFYTETEAEMILFRSPVPYRAGVEAREWAEMWIYPRDKTNALSKILNAGDVAVLLLVEHSHLIDKTDIVLSEWVSLKTALTLTHISKERLYQITKRSKVPKIPYKVVNGKMIFLKSGVMTYGHNRIPEQE